MQAQEVRHKLVRFDWAIKYLLRNKANFDILEGFLSELLNTDIKIESLLESESNKNTREDRFNRVDLLCQTDKKERIIIEVQCSSEYDYLSRILYGTSKAVVEYIKESEPYSDIKKVISVSIVFFDMGKGKDYLYKGSTQFVGLHHNDILKLGPGESKIYGTGKLPADVFPEYYIIKVNQFDQRVKNKFDEWIYFLKNEQIKPEFKAKGIRSAVKKLDILRLSPDERYSYSRYQDDLHYEASMVLWSDYGMARQEGREEGRVEGLLEGRQEGLKEGLEEGEQKEKHRIAKSMKQAGLAISTIAQCVGLSVSTIENL